MTFVDSAKIQVCHNLRILRHQVLKVPRSAEKERWGGSTTLNYTLLSVDQSGMISIKVTTANVDK
ncbi:Mobile element protein [Candidatus Enterovibrio escicola]|uniref:Mobile element protein n=1 Tax=Candidatus Enterovibrio escicola TaxID=1927127 RepID=A0A2A5SZ22_9GAMM|nr:Mobile element protein [Candidatus Enterovibrio escacola]